MENFIELLKSMKNNGITSIYLSHELNEVLNFSDRITVLKDGKVICSEKNENLNEQWVMSNMSGRKLDRAQNIDIFLKEKGITEREKEIIFSVMKGLSNKEISDNLFISVNTVKTHIANVYQKMGVSQRMDLANLFKGMI
jgi:DNA-binding NarL/FixJ family response regulator